MDEMLQAQEKNTEEPRLYELGYHLIPALPEESLAGEVAKLQEGIAARGGVVMTEGAPKKTQLAYRLPHVQDNKRTFFDSSYFGWVRFQMTPREAEAFRNDMADNPSVIRFLLIIAMPEKTASPRKIPFFAESKNTHQKEERARERAGETTDTVNEAEIDKTIEELIAE